MVAPLDPDPAVVAPPDPDPAVDAPPDPAVVATPDPDPHFFTSVRFSFVSFQAKNLAFRMKETKTNCKYCVKNFK